MRPELWRRVEDLYDRALKLDESQRAVFLRDECAGDRALQEEVERLLGEDQRAGSFLEEPALQQAARKLAEENSRSGEEPHRGVESAAISMDAGQSSWIARRIGPYDVVSLLGVGGMGEVYRARDINLKRDVAVKVLPSALARDPDRLTRLRREAQLLASLNHSNIAAIYGLEEFQGAPCIVMELVPGETLADRLTRGRLDLEETLRVGVQIAEALKAAHEKGIIHRDLKPANIKLTPDGNMKVLDFGLAKVREMGETGADLSNSPTMISRTGMVLGTAAYMSPEQAKGNDVDGASDVWAFGCVLYEMLTGRVVFQGATAGEVLGEVLKSEPQWSWLPADTPEGIRRLLCRCLRKDRRRRLHDMADVLIEIEDVQTGTPTDGHAVQSASGLKKRLARAAALTLVALLAAVAIVWIFGPRQSPAEVRLEITTPPSTQLGSLEISPDGQKIVYAATSEGKSGLWLRPLDSVSARPLAGTEGAAGPFWSPDSRSIGFFADGRLKRIGINDGTVQVLANSPRGIGGAWNQDGVILCATGNSGPIFRLSATGRGEPVAVPRSESSLAHHAPQFLPDGFHFLYSMGRGVYVGQLDGSVTRLLVDADTADIQASGATSAMAAYASSGQLLFVRQGTLFAQNFDLSRLELTGNPFPVAEHVAGLSVSNAGPIVYRNASVSSERRFVWFDRSGKEIQKLEPVPDSANSSESALSRDGRHVALQRSVSGNTDIWLLETEQGVLSRLTFDARADMFPLWSPNGSQIVFGSSRNGGNVNLYQKSLTGAGSEELLLATSGNKAATDWSLDGRFLLYRTSDPKTGFDIWTLPLDGDRKPSPVVQTNFEERDAQFSPDGKWIAYQSNESGQFEIYVQPFSGLAAKRRISSAGGAQVRWRLVDGKELFYIALDGRLMAVPIQLPSHGDVEAGAPVPLFATHVNGAVQFARQQYSVSRDGQRYLMNTVSEASSSSSTVILNWKAKP